MDANREGWVLGAAFYGGGWHRAEETRHIPIRVHSRSFVFIRVNSWKIRKDSLMDRIERQLKKDGR